MFQWIFIKIPARAFLGFVLHCKMMTNSSVGIDLGKERDLHEKNPGDPKSLKNAG